MNRLDWLTARYTPPDDLEADRQAWLEEQAEAAYYEQLDRESQAQADAGWDRYDPDDRHVDARGSQNMGADDIAMWRHPEEPNIGHWL